jgi:glycosyltransferase involved in cell wall biosynthesis
MKKYLFVASNEWANWGGSELLWSSTAKALAREGNEVRASVPGFVKESPQVEQLRSAGCQLFFRPNFPPFSYRWGRRMLPFLPEYNLKHLRAASRGVDLVVISQGSHQDGIWWLEAVKSEGLKYALIIQSASELWWPDDVMAERLAASYEQAACVYCVSQDTLSLFRLQLATPLSRGKVIRNPFNVPYDARPAWPENGTHELSLACVARLDGATKGHDLLLRVLALPHWRKRSAQVSLIGKGMNERVLGMMAKLLKLESVKFAGHQNDIESIWRTHHALVLPSRFEGMPLVIVEAMLCGRPCIATDVGGSRELIRDGIN